MPWATFPTDVEKALRDIIVSFKQNLRVINKTSNHSLRFVDGKKKFVPQTIGDSWAIRKSMHKETVFGEVNLRRTKQVALKEALLQPQRIVDRDLKEKIKAMLALGYNEKQMKAYFTENADTWQDVNLRKIEVYYFTKETSDRFFATRKSIDTSFSKDFIETKITDTGIQQILLRHLERHNNKAELAFSPDGIDEMNRNIRELNMGHNHQPIYKVRVYEKADKFTVGQTGNKSKKFVEAAKGTNLFFAIYEDTIIDKQSGKTEKKRSFRTIPLNEAILKMKQGLPLDEQALFILSPNDLVYLPTEEENKKGEIQMPLDKSRIYKMVSSSGVDCHFIQERVSSPVVDKKEFSPLNKMERAITGETIKKTCIPLKVDRLGNIIQIGV